MGRDPALGRRKIQLGFSEKFKKKTQKVPWFLLLDFLVPRNSPKDGSQKKLKSRSGLRSEKFGKR